MTSFRSIAAASICAACSAGRAATHSTPRTPETTSSGTSLSPEAVASVVKGANPKFQGCLFLASSPDSQGTVKVSWDVAPSGKVGDARAEESSFPDAPVIRCVVKQMQRLQFPEASAPTSATWTFVFKHASAR